MMETSYRLPTDDRTGGKRHHMFWAKKALPLNNSALFNKAKHSEEWHRDVEATSGVLHPSDPKFPIGFLRNYTDTYLRRKGKINQADIDIRLVILVNAHRVKDVAVASVAHVMTAKSLRELLQVDLNVAQGSYWGLETWLQSLIAANAGNAASVTDLEARWAHMLLPYATHGARAAALFLEGVSAVLTTSRTPSLNVLPEFFTLWRRALADYSAQLQSFRLRAEWLSAHHAVLWMRELQKTSPLVTPPGHLLPEHLLDSQFPIWRLWAKWTPDMDRIARFAKNDNSKLATIPDAVALEGPDVLTGREATLRDGLVSQYRSERPWIRSGALIIQVPDRTKAGLRNTLERIARSLDFILTRQPSESGYESSFRLFRDFTVTQPITGEGLDMIAAALNVPYTPENDIYNTVREIHADRHALNGQHILVFQRLIRTLDDPQAEGLANIILQPWLVQGIENCLYECRAVVKTHIDMSLPWFHLALELYEFCATLKGSLRLVGSDICNQLEYIPPTEHMRMVAQIYSAVQASYLRTHSSAQKKSPPKPTDLLGEKQKMRNPLKTMIETYCIHRLLEPNKIWQATESTLSPIFNVWESTAGPETDNDRRALAILASKNVYGDDKLERECLEDVASGTQLVQSPDQVQHLLAIMIQADAHFEQAIVDLTKFLGQRLDAAQCWKGMLFRWLQQQSGTGAIRNTSVVDHCLKTMKSAEWLSFMLCLRKIFANVIDSPSLSSEEVTVLCILKPQMLDWTTQVSRFTATLTKLEDVLEDRDAINCILTCSGGVWAKNVLSILECLESAKEQPAETTMYRLVGMLSAEKSNDWEVKECLFILLNATPEIAQACERIWNSKQGFLEIPGLAASTQPAHSPVASKRGFVGLGASTRVFGHRNHRKGSTVSIDSSLTSTSTPTPTPNAQVPPSVAELMVAGWIQRDDLDEVQKIAIESVAKLLDIAVYRDVIPTDKMQEATTFWNQIEQEIVQEASRLEALQKALKAKDPQGTTLLLQELGIPDSSLFDEEIDRLPADLANMVERTGDNEVEISFSITTYTELQRSGMGIPRAANTVLLRLFVDYSGDMPPSFCVHFDSDANLDSIEHTPKICSKDSSPPQEKLCKATETAFTWQLNRIVHTELQKGNVRIAELHKLVKKRMEELSHSCVSCGLTHHAANAQLRRSTPCDVIACAQLWYQLPLDIRIPEIRTDTFVVDMLLTTVYAAASTNKPELLSGCPIRGNEVIKTILNSLPSLTVISHAVNISTVLKPYHKDAEKLISWACVQHRGYIATATGLCKIPNLPAGTHQFVLANARPRLESAFVHKIPKANPKTMVLFHGTSLDRLPAILSQGLKTCSGTSLQRTGAAHGKGIYMAEEPSTSFTYAPSSLSWRNSGLPNMRLLLGCEVVGNGRSVSSGIHVITDERSVMVRYIFLFTNYATSPNANTIVPAMASGMSALRSGAM